MLTAISAIKSVINKKKKYIKRLGNKQKFDSKDVTMWNLHVSKQTTART